jgi:hypothetical protein
MKKSICRSFAILALLVAFGLFVAIDTGNAAQTKSARNTLDAYAPFEELIQVTPSDSTTYDPPLRGCFVESIAGGSDLVLTPSKNSSSVTLTVIAGQLVPVIIDKVGASTTATVLCGR